MITTALWGVVGGLTGLLAFIVLPLFGSVLDELDGQHGWRYRLAQPYFTLSMKSYGRVIAMISPHNDLSITSSSWDSDDQTEELSEGEQTEKRVDPKNTAARCKNQPFNLGFTDPAFLIHPLDAHVGNALDRIDTAGRRWMEFVVGDGDEQQVVRAHSAHANIPRNDQYHALDLQRARIALTESHEAGDMFKTREDVKKSQSGYGDRNTVEMVLVLVACFGGALAAWVIYSNTGSTESAVRLPVTLFGWFL